jgi:hypothetical protein
VQLLGDRGLEIAELVLLILRRKVASREDNGSHTVCAVMTAAFLEFSKSRGNAL